MINALKEKMSPNDYEEFIKDYRDLTIAKNNRKEWREAQTQRPEKAPLFKNYFDNKIESPYSYKEFKFWILNDNDFKIAYSWCMAFEPNTPHKSLIKDYFRLYYTTHIYIGFIVEELLCNELSKYINKRRIIRNKVLDIEKKTDILCNGTHLQLKNISFISSVMKEKLLKEYKHCCRDLFFIFYTIEEENIYFISIDGRALAYIDSIELLSAFNEYKNLPLNEYTSLLLAALFS